MTAPGCRARDRCPVPDPRSVDLRRIRLAHLDVGETFHRVHRRGRRPDGFNRSGRGDTRFGPLPGLGHLYLGATRTVALLESVFHNVHDRTPRMIYVATDLAGYQLTEVVVRRRVPLVDLTDQGLERLGLDRRSLVATSAAHYPCTRRWGELLSRRKVGGVPAAGILWNSRVAELAGRDSPLLDDLLGPGTSRVGVLYDRVARGEVLAVAGPTFTDLGDGQGRLLVEDVAEQLDAEVH